MRVWFVTGASRGFGLELTRQALLAGDAVVATARTPAAVAEGLDGAVDVERLLPIGLDVTNADAARSAVEAALERFGRIDVLVNNAGRGIIGAIEEVSDAEARSVFEVNVFGVLNVTRAALPALRRQGAGHIIMMSSMGGFTQPGSGWGIYGASKFAVEGLSEALAHEVEPLGISVTLVEPGSFRTEFLNESSIQLAQAQLAAYTDTAGATRTLSLQRDGEQLGDPARAVRAIRRIVELPDPPLRLALGADAVAAIEAKLAAVAADLDSARELADVTAYQ